MRPIDVWGLALGAIIGWGCFVLPGSAFLPKAGPAGTAAGMLIGALLIIVIALSYGYMIRNFPVSGGEFIYAKEAIGKRNAFVCGWGMILAYWSLTFTFHFHAWEKEMATHSSVLAWRIPGTGEPGGLLSMGSHRVRHD